MPFELSKFSRRLRAIYRHPFNSKKRKRYRANADGANKSDGNKENAIPFDRGDILPILQQISDGRRISLVTDSLGPHVLFGGVGTAIVLCSLLADRLGGSLRIITRMEESEPKSASNVLRANGIDFKHKIETVYAPANGGPVPLSDGDIVIPMSWWTVKPVLGSIPRSQIAYILQEDERMFYPRGDMRQWCSETLAERGFPVVVNSKLLFDHFLEHEPIPGFGEDAIWFEPAITIARPNEITPAQGKRRLFFYARPDNPRNLFWHGVECIRDGLELNILDRREWEIHFVGRNIPHGLFPPDVSQHFWEALDWSAYQELVKTMDLGISLMDTPHPSYPPLDLAAAGASVLTTSSLNKIDLTHYSQNITVAEPNPRGLRKGLQKAVGLAMTPSQRMANCSEDNIQRDWNAAFAATVSRLADHFSKSTSC